MHATRISPNCWPGSAARNSACFRLQCRPWRAWFLWTWQSSTPAPRTNCRTPNLQPLWKEPTTMTKAAAEQQGHPKLTDALRGQPKTVWVTAFAAVIAFMGIGLVDPILNILTQ